MIAQHGAASWPLVSNMCLQSIKQAIEYQMDGSTKEKKSKQT